MAIYENLNRPICTNSSAKALYQKPSRENGFLRTRNVSCDRRQRSIHEMASVRSAWGLTMREKSLKISLGGWRTRARNLGELSRHLRRNSSRSNRSLVIKLRIGFQLYELALAPQSGLQEPSLTGANLSRRSSANYPFSLKRFFLRLVTNFSYETLANLSRRFWQTLTELMEKCLASIAHGDWHSSFIIGNRHVTRIVFKFEGKQKYLS